MTDKADFGIQGLQELQEKNLRTIAALQPSGRAGQAIKDATIAAHRYAVSITHVWWYKGGGLKASHRMEVKKNTGRIYIDPNAVNPRGQKPSIYGPVEHARGGSHAFYERTEKEAGPQITRNAVRTIQMGVYK